MHRTTLCTCVRLYCFHNTFRYFISLWFPAYVNRRTIANSRLTMICYVKNNHRDVFSTKALNYLRRTGIDFLFLKNIFAPFMHLFDKSWLSLLPVEAKCGNHCKLNVLALQCDWFLNTPMSYIMFSHTSLQSE